MKNNFYILITILINALLITQISCQKIDNLCLIDTAQNEAYIYQPTIKILEAVRFKCTYLPLAKILDKKKELNLKKYSTIFFIICPEFLISLQNKNLATTSVLNLIKKELAQPNKLIAFFIPSHIHKFVPIQNLFKTLGIHINENATKFNYEIKNINFNEENFINFMENQSILSETFPTVLSKSIKAKLKTNINKILAPPLEIDSSDTFLRFDDKFYFNNNFDFLNNLSDLATFNALICTFLLEPLEIKCRNYNTSISKLRLHQNYNFHPNNNLKNITIAPLPITKASPSISLAPYGIYWYNPLNKNHLFIGSNSILNFAGISENFNILPICKEKKEILLQEVTQLFTELRHISKQTNRKWINFQNTPKAPKITVLKNKITGKQKGTKIAWMEIEIFKNEKEVEKQNLLIDYIYKAGLDYLWISLAPNMYFSPIGYKKQEIETFLAMISSFTKTLKERNHGSKYPQILIGFEIANNLHGENLPKNYPIDIYGNNYEDIPTPLNDQFWENEIIIPARKLSLYWKDKKISNGIPISGFVIDLEMYLRKTSGAFLSTMSFDTETFYKYSFKKLHKISIQEYLINNKLLENYYSFSSKKSISLGKKLKNEFKHACPNCVIACYAPNIYPNWFYKGLYRGLSEDKNPIMLFTFNTEFLGHQNWLQKNKIYAKHFTALMLSKIQTEADFILSDGDIWINRFSRFIDEKIPGAWYTNEQSTLKKENIHDFLNYLSEN